MEVQDPCINCEWCSCEHQMNKSKEDQTYLKEKTVCHKTLERSCSLYVGYPTDVYQSNEIKVTKLSLGEKENC